MTEQLSYKYTQRMTPTMGGMVEQYADRRGISTAGLVRRIVAEHIEEYADLSPEEERYVEIQQERHRERIHKEIATRHMKEASFPQWIKKRARVMYNHYNMAPEDITRWIELQFPIADMRDCKGALEQIHRSIERNDFRWTTDDTTPRGESEHERQHATTR